MDGSVKMKRLIIGSIVSIAITLLVFKLGANFAEHARDTVFFFGGAVNVWALMITNELLD
jgi:hypothetical protein